MSKLIISYEKSTTDVPVLIVAHENYGLLNPSINVIKTFTGDKAEKLYKELTGKEVRNNA